MFVLYSFDNFGITILMFRTSPKKVDCKEVFHILLSHAISAIMEENIRVAQGISIFKIERFLQKWRELRNLAKCKKSLTEDTRLS